MQLHVMSGMVLQSPCCSTLQPLNRAQAQKRAMAIAHPYCSYQMERRSRDCSALHPSSPSFLAEIIRTSPFDIQ